MSELLSGGIRLPLCIVAAATLFPLSANASCGAAFCPVNTQWHTQGIWTEPGWRADIRYEYIPQKQPRAEDSTIAVGQIPHHHDEMKTFNHNMLATLDYGFADGMGITLTAPVTHRSHSHIHNHMGAKLLEHWNFTEIGDVQAIGRYQFKTWNDPYVYGLYLGAKLPTGRRNLRNNDGDLAERSLQPGTGTADALVGFYFRQNLLDLQSSWFMQALLQQSLHERDEYKPGERLSVDVGYRYDVTERISLMLQLNGQYRDRDSGAEAEPRDSGGHSLSLSPGASYGVTETVQIYGFIQKPLYQYVNGVQLTADWSAIAGISLHF